MKTRTFKGFFDKIDYKLLVSQKDALIDKILKEEDNATKELLEGIHTLLDSVQDTAEENGYDVPYYSRAHMIAIIKKEGKSYTHSDINILTDKQLEELFLKISEF